MLPPKPPSPRLTINYRGSTIPVVEVTTMPSGTIEADPEPESEGGGVRLGKLQLAIMRVLWRRGEAAGAEGHEDREAERRLGPTTLATLCANDDHQDVVPPRHGGR